MMLFRKYHQIQDHQQLILAHGQFCFRMKPNGSGSLVIFISIHVRCLTSTTIGLLEQAAQSMGCWSLQACVLCLNPVSTTPWTQAKQKCLQTPAAHGPNIAHVDNDSSSTTTTPLTTLNLHHVPSIIISTPIWKSLWLYICQKDLCRSFLLTIWYCCTHTSVCGKYILVFYANLFCCSSQQVEMCSFCLLIRVKLKIGISHKRGRGSSLNLSKNSLLDSP